MWIFALPSDEEGVNAMAQNRLKKMETPQDLSDVMGGATGEADDATVAGGWAGTDDDTSTAPSDRIGLPEENPLDELTGGAVTDRNSLDRVVGQSTDGDGSIEGPATGGGRAIDQLESDLIGRPLDENEDPTDYPLAEEG